MNQLQYSSENILNNIKQHCPINEVIYNPKNNQIIESLDL